jgi:hypothetical protein
MFYTKLKDHVREMKKTAEAMMPYTPPKYPKDDDFSWLKTRDIIVDGIAMVVHYSLADHGDLKPAILTIGPKYGPVIPFITVCKTARAFLGDEYLTLFEYTIGGSKIYSWMVLLQEDKPVENQHSSRGEKESHNGFDFFRIDTNNEQEVTSEVD